MVTRFLQILTEGFLTLSYEIIRWALLSITSPHMVTRLLQKGFLNTITWDYLLSIAQDWTSCMVTRFLQRGFLNAIAWHNLLDIWPPLSSIEKPSMLFLLMRVTITDVIVPYVTPVSEKTYSRNDKLSKVEGQQFHITYKWMACSWCEHSFGEPSV